MSRKEIYDYCSRCQKPSKKFTKVSVLKEIPWICGPCLEGFTDKSFQEKGALFLDERKIQQKQTGTKWKNKRRKVKNRGVHSSPKEESESVEVSYDVFGVVELTEQNFREEEIDKNCDHLQCRDEPQILPENDLDSNDQLYLVEDDIQEDDFNLGRSPQSLHVGIHESTSSLHAEDIIPELQEDCFNVGGVEELSQGQEDQEYIALRNQGFEWLRLVNFTCLPYEELHGAIRILHLLKEQSEFQCECFSVTGVKELLSQKVKFSRYEAMQRGQGNQKVRSKTNSRDGSHTYLRDQSNNQNIKHSQVVHSTALPLSERK